MLDVTHPRSRLVPPNRGLFRGVQMLVLISAIGLVCCAEPESRSQAISSNTTAAAAGQNAEATEIDQQVAQILAGEHGTLPPVQAIRIDPAAQSAEMQIENDTDYVLTVFYSGPTHRSVVVSPHGRQSVTLGIGTYGVAAMVSASDVQPFAGSQSLQGGEYGTSFYIEEVRE
jgi:hypothetical protein